MFKKIFILPIRFYQKYISPAFGKKCIYTPGCSSYTIQAIEKHGVFKGLILGFARLFRCSRFFLGGYDPVPEVFSFKEIKNTYIVFKRSLK